MKVECSNERLPVGDIIRQHLHNIGADCLGNCNIGCGCCVDDKDWPPCDGIQSNCVPAQKRLCQCCGDWFIVRLESIERQCEECRQLREIE
jgi:hypothetical protein